MGGAATSRISHKEMLCQRSIVTGRPIGGRKQVAA